MTSLGRRVATALIVAGLAAAGPGCGDDGDSADRSLLEFRPVLATNPPPCAEKAPEGVERVLPLSTDGKVTECLALGQPVVDARDVRSASVAETPSKEPALSVILGSVGSSNLDGFARRNLGQRLAIVADGTLVSAPVLRNASFAGRAQITGLSKEKTDEMFRRLDKLIKSR